MLITSFCYATGSFFHEDGKNTERKIANHVCLIAAGTVLDGVLAVALVLIGLFSLTSFAPHALYSLPLSAKLTMIAGSSIFVIIDGVYVYYRHKKLNSAMQKRLHHDQKEILNHLDKTDQKLSEETLKASECIKYLEELVPVVETKLKKLKPVIEILQTQSKSEKEQGSSEVHGINRLEQALTIQRDLEYKLQQINDLRQRVQDETIARRLIQEEIHAHTEEVLNTIHGCQKILS